MPPSRNEPPTKSPPPVWRPRVRARLLLAFLAIAGFGVLAAAAGIYAFRLVGERLDVVDTRLPPTMAALQLSRSAERIIGAAPSLLAAGDRRRLEEVESDLSVEIEFMGEQLAALGTERSPPVDSIVAVVSMLTARLEELNRLVALRLDGTERISGLRSGVFEASAQVQRLLQPWLEVIRYEISTLADGSATEDSITSADRDSTLRSLIQLQQQTQSALRRTSEIVDLLIEASTTERVQRLRILEFQLDLALGGLEQAAAGLDVRVQPLFKEEVAQIKRFVDGADAVALARRSELALIAEGETLVEGIMGLSARLSRAVDRLGAGARHDINQAIANAVRVHELGTRVLVVLVALSVLTSLLIVWLYVGRNIVRRLTELNDSMRAIADGKLDAPVQVDGTDEISAMGQVVEILRHNTLERDELLLEKTQTADLLEREVAQRTTELQEALERQMAAGEILHIIASSPASVQPVFDAIARSVTRLCGVPFCLVYRFDNGLLHFAAHHGLTPAAIDLIQRGGSLVPDRGSAVSRAILDGRISEIPDVDSDPEYRRGELDDAVNLRSAVAVPMLKNDRPLGAVVIARTTPGYFPERQINLLRTFADQAVIAIENTRLFNEIEDKTRKLEMADKYKSHFLASASHDLRQPLHALNLFVGQLQSESDPGARQRLAASIDAAVGSMNTLFESLLDMSKLEAGVLEPHVTTFPVRRVLEHIATTFADAARQKGLRFTMVRSDQWVSSDFIMLQRMLMNLVSNAVRYTNNGRVLVGCRRRREHLRIDVYDSGPGIAPEQQRTIFDEYYQLSVASESKERGLGLGLAIVDRLGRLLGHPVTLQSAPGRGSRFSVTVPMAVRRDLDDSAPRAPELTDPLKEKLVVIVDDDPLVIDGMKGILRSWGCRVLAAQTGSSVLEELAASGRRPSVLIADYRLAEGNTGLDVIRDLRESMGEEFPAFLISGDTSPERLRDAHAHGIHLLHKPVSPMQLRSMLLGLLNPPRSTG